MKNGVKNHKDHFRSKSRRHKNVNPDAQRSANWEGTVPNFSP